MPSQKKRQRAMKCPVKRLLGDLLPRKSAKKAKIVTRQLVTNEDSSGEFSNEVTCSSSSALKRYEEIKKNKGTSHDPTLQQLQHCSTQPKPQQQLQSAQV